MKNAIVILLCLSSLSLWSQSVEFFAGGNSNHFFGNSQASISKCQSDIGYSFGISVDGLKPFLIPLKVSLQYSRYGGGVSLFSEGKGGWSRTRLETSKSIVSLIVFPLNLEVDDKINFNFGVEYSKLVNESFSGRNSGWIMTNISWDDDLKDSFSQLNSQNNFGFVFQTSYDYEINESLSITPIYMIYLGFSKEFSPTLKNTKSFRNFIGIGIKKAFKVPQLKLP